MSQSLDREKAEFYDLVKCYEYFTSKGWFDLEAFCVSISLCLVCDEQQALAPEPIDIYDVFLEVAQNRLNPDDFELYIKHPDSTDQAHLDVHDYLEHSITSVHVAGLLECMHDWVMRIGNLLKCSILSKRDDLYFGWIDPEWRYTHTLISGLHVAIVAFIKSVDEQNLAKIRESQQIPADKNDTKAFRYDFTEQNTQQILLSHQAIKDKIFSAIESGFSLEAIALEECLIKSCLLHFLAKHGAVGKGLTLNQMLTHDQAVQHAPIRLIDDITSWHKQKHTSVNEYIEAHAQALTVPGGRFEIDCTDTALDGLKLCREVYNWFCDHVLVTIPNDGNSDDKANHH
jgi:hypothetical protein